MGAISFKRSQITAFEKYRSLLVGNPAFEPPPEYPAFLDSAPLWLDAADASTITESGGSVSQWDNKGTLENLSNGNASTQPTTGVETLNGLNVIDFNDDFVRGSNKSQWQFLHDGTDFFFALVGKGDIPDEKGTFFQTGSGRSTEKGFAFRYQDNAGPGRIRLVSNASGQAVTIIEDNMFPVNQYNLSSGIVDAQAATTADRATYFLNQGTVNAENTGTGSFSGGDPHDNFTLGIFENANLDGQIAELIIVSGADATESNRQTVVNYLNAKWSVF